ncbi:MAG: type III-B CRISPR module-associated protein Cmr5 [Dehalococcoidia bacterium]|jgi:CRISPR-associated protein Cmr5
MNQTIMKGIEQGRAVFAYNQIEEAITVLGNDNNLLRKYKSYTKKVPMYIKTNGLGSTLAFIKSKNSDKAWKMIYSQISKWLKSCTPPWLEDGDELVEKIIALSSAEYRAVTVEVLALFNWLRRFAEGLIEGDADDE